MRIAQKKSFKVLLKGVFHRGRSLQTTYSKKKNAMYKKWIKMSLKFKKEHMPFKY